MEYSHCWQLATPPSMTSSFLCTIHPAKSHDLGIWGPPEKDTVSAQPSIQRIN